MAIRELSNYEELVERLNNQMMKSSEVGKLAVYLEDVQETEKYNSCLFSDSEILKAYWEAADSCVDSHIQNEYDTPESDRCPGCRTRDEAVADWESMRPSNIRRKELLKKFGGI